MKNKTKLGKLSVSVMLALAALSMPCLANAASGLDDSTLYLGYKTTAKGAAATAVGNQNSAGTELTHVGATAVGYHNQAHNQYSSALGSFNGAYGTQSSALGYSNNVNGSDSSAIGSQNSASNAQASALGTKNVANGNFTSAIGYNNRVQKVTYDDNMDETVTAVYGGAAIGMLNKSTNTYGTALGVQNTASGYISAAVGAANVTGGKYSSAVGVLNNAYGNNSGAFGYHNTVGSASTDKNGNDVFDTSKGQLTYVLGANNNVLANKALVLGIGNAIGDTTAEGADEPAEANTIVLGSNNNFTAESVLVLGSGVTKVAKNSVVIGNGSSSEDEDTVSVGTEGGERKIVHVAEGVNDTDAVNFSQIKTEEGIYIKASVMKADETEDEEGAAELNSEGTVGKNLAALDTAIGAVDKDYTFIKRSVNSENTEENVSVAQNLINLDQGVTQLISYDKSSKVISIGGGSDVVSDATISVGGRKITNVAEGTDDTDAVNKAQLEKAIQGTNGSMKEGFDRLDNDIRRVGAGAAALAALRPEAFDPMDKWSFAVGYGHYKSANAGALGAFFKPNADTTLSIGSTIGNGDAMMNAGISFKFGQRSAKLSQNASNSQLVQEVNTLRAQNAEQESKIESQDKEIRELKEQMAQVLAKLGG